ncbi:hydroxymethylglutaryl-CoA lyase [Frondihabitans australicus]|uniref:Hydroxymethylglutaryl-CoA lyase n=1 Tax=Frondihabitans australicus TaxID=386892 RepID=A0A495IGC0_9MICO|nr:hydroxymethylglutaryl-CoA lyase [Frondihabitans australicus]RKR75062.1 hydroxymethylglutaryl-CoA lyase [Frondihabitans australicus]
MPDFAYPRADDVVLRDATLRDGLQLTGSLLPTEAKVRLARGLFALGFTEIEIGAMARPDRVPPMANTLDVIEALTPDELDKSWIWAATPRSIERALDAGGRNFEYCFSATDSHNLANVGRTVEQSLDAMPDAFEKVLSAGGRIQLTLATSFTCPFDGAVDPDRVIAIATDPRVAGTSSIAVCDTIGQAVPTQVAALVARTLDDTAFDRVYFHGHDTWGLGVANALAAVGAGAAALDGALAGLGGCPFAPGASGNTSTEDLLFALRPAWITPSTFADLVRLGEGLVADVAEPNRSKAAEGARSTSHAFEWVIPAG